MSNDNGNELDDNSDSDNGNEIEDELEDAYEEIVNKIKPIRKIKDKYVNKNSATPNDGVSLAPIDKMLKNVWGRLNSLRQKFGFNTVKEEFDTFLKTRDKYSRGIRSKQTLGDIEVESIEAELESLLGRLAVFGSLEADEVRLLKAQEKPIRILGKEIDLGNYRKLMVYAGYAGGAYFGYKWIIAPLVLPSLKKLLTTKVKVKKVNSGNSGFSDIRDAEFTVI